MLAGTPRPYGMSPAAPPPPALAYAGEGAADGREAVRLRRVLLEAAAALERGTAEAWAAVNPTGAEAVEGEEAFVAGLQRMGLRLAASDARALHRMLAPDGGAVRWAAWSAFFEADGVSAAERKRRLLWSRQIEIIRKLAGTKAEGRLSRWLQAQQDGTGCVSLAAFKEGLAQQGVLRVRQHRALRAHPMDERRQAQAQTQERADPVFNNCEYQV